MDREVKTSRGLQPLHDPSCVAVIGRSRGGFSVNIRLKMDFDGAPIRPRSDEGERVPRPVRVAPRAALADEGYYAKPHLEGSGSYVHNSAGSLPSSANRKRRRSMPPPKPVRLPSAPMTRRHGRDRDRIASVRRADRARRLRRADHGGDLAIRTRFAERVVVSVRQTRFWKSVPSGASGRSNALLRPAKYASSWLRAASMIALFPVAHRRGAAMLAAFERETAQRHIVGHESQHADRALVVVTDHGFGPSCLALGGAPPEPHGWHRRARDGVPQARRELPGRRRWLIAGGNASGSPNARSATYSMVHGPTPV